jgi:chromosomal replication initiator protein
MQANLLYDINDSSSFDSFMLALQEAIKSGIGETIFYAWFKDLTFKAYDGKTLLLSVKNDKVKNCIFLHYQNRFEKILKKTFYQHSGEKLSNFDLIVEEGSSYFQANLPEVKISEPLSEETKPSAFNIKITLEKKYTFENFLEVNENKLAVGVARHLAHSISNQQQDVLQFSKQFFIYGGIGNGKTHLAQSIAHEIQKNSSEKVLYTTAERFMFNYMTAAKNNNTVEFHSEFIGIKFLIIDDIHFVASKKKTIEEIQRISYSVISDGGFVLFCSSNLPSILPIENEMVKSFFNSSYCIKIEDPTEDFRCKILKAKLKTTSFKVSDNIIKVLASKIQNNIRELEGAMGRMVLHSQILDYEINEEGTKFITTDIFPHKELKKFSVHEIQNAVCSSYGITLEEMQSKKRTKSILKARQSAIFLATKLTTCSYVEIGRNFGGRTHSTVINSIKSINKECEKSKSFKELIDSIRIKIEEQL